MSRISLPNQLPLFADSFTGTSPYIEVDAPGAEHYSGQPLTLLAYVKKHSAGGGNAGVIYARTDGTTNYLVLGVDTNSSSGYRFNATSGTAGSPAVASERMFGNASGQWHHIGAVWDGSVSSSSMTLYGSINNGLLQDVTNTSASGTGSVSDSPTAAVRVGSLGASRPFTGEIAYVARWNRVLSYTELLLAQRFGPSSVPNGLVFYYKDGVDVSYTKNTITKNYVRAIISNNVWRGVNTREVFYSLGPSPVHEISGNPTESVDTSSGTLSLSLAISGAVSEVVDSATGQVSNVVSLTGTVTESTDVSTGSVDLEVNVTGTTVEQLDTSSGTVSISDGSVYISGTVTETRDTVSGSVAAVTSVEGIVTEGSDTVSGTLQTTVSLTGTVLENSDSATGSVSILSALSVTGTTTESSDTLSGYLDNPEAQGTKGGNGKAKLKKKKKVKVSVDTSELDTLVQQLQTDGKTYAVTQIESVKNILEYSELEIPATFSEAVVIAETLVKTSVETTDEWALNMIKTLLTHILVLQDKLQDAEDVILLLSSD